MDDEHRVKGATADRAGEEEVRACAELLLRLGPRLGRCIAERMRWDNPDRGLSPRQLEVLTVVGEGRPTLGGLAACLGITPTVVTGIVDRLARQGYLRRQADPRDRRVVRLRLTDAGNAARAAAARAVVDRLDADPIAGD